jgi:hypothetical protein
VALAEPGAVVEMAAVLETAAVQEQGRAAQATVVMAQARAHQMPTGQPARHQYRKLQVR